jgi:hypothetical protein
MVEQSVGVADDPYAMQRVSVDRWALHIAYHRWATEQQHLSQHTCTQQQSSGQRSHVYLCSSHILDQGAVHLCSAAAEAQALEPVPPWTHLRCGYMHGLHSCTNYQGHCLYRWCVCACSFSSRGYYLDGTAIFGSAVLLVVLLALTFERILGLDRFINQAIQ